MREGKKMPQPENIGWYEYQELCFDDVDKPEDVGVIDKPRLDSYARQIRAKIPGPAIVVYSKGGGRYGLIDGLHRMIISEAFGYKKCLAIVLHLKVKPTPEWIADFRTGLHKNGHPTTTVRDGCHQWHGHGLKPK